MAAEFSRDQSAKVGAGKICKIAAEAASSAGSPPCGLPSRHGGQNQQVMGVLQHGEYKSANSYRTILVPAQRRRSPPFAAPSTSMW